MQKIALRPLVRFLHRTPQTGFQYEFFDWFNSANSFWGPVCQLNIQQLNQLHKFEMRHTSHGRLAMATGCHQAPGQLNGKHRHTLPFAKGASVESNLQLMSRSLNPNQAKGKHLDLCLSLCNPYLGQTYPDLPHVGSRWFQQKCYTKYGGTSGAIVFTNPR